MEQALVGYWVNKTDGVSATVFLRRTDGRYLVEIKDTDEDEVVGIKTFGSRFEADTYARLSTEE